MKRFLSLLICFAILCPYGAAAAETDGSFEVKLTVVSNPGGVYLAKVALEYDRSVFSPVNSGDSFMLGSFLNPQPMSGDDTFPVRFAVAPDAPAGRYTIGANVLEAYDDQLSPVEGFALAGADVLIEYETADGKLAQSVRIEGEETSEADDEIARLKAELAALQSQLDALLGGQAGPEPEARENVPAPQDEPDAGGEAAGADAAAENPADDSSMGFEYRIEDQEAVIFSYQGSDTEIVIVHGDEFFVFIGIIRKDIAAVMQFQTFADFLSFRCQFQVFQIHQ